MCLACRLLLGFHIRLHELDMFVSRILWEWTLFNIERTSESHLFPLGILAINVRCYCIEIVKQATHFSRFGGWFHHWDTIQTLKQRIGHILAWSDNLRPQRKLILKSTFLEVSDQGIHTDRELHLITEGGSDHWLESYVTRDHLPLLVWLQNVAILGADCDEDVRFGA